MPQPRDTPDIPAGEPDVYLRALLTTSPPSMLRSRQQTLCFSFVICRFILYVFIVCAIFSEAGRKLRGERSSLKNIALPLWHHRIVLQPLHSSPHASPTRFITIIIIIIIIVIIHIIIIIVTIIVIIYVCRSRIFLTACRKEITFLLPLRRKDTKTTCPVALTALTV